MLIFRFSDEEADRIGDVRLYAHDLSRREDHQVRLLSAEQCAYRDIICEVDLLPGTQKQIVMAVRPQIAHD